MVKFTHRKLFLLFFAFISIIALYALVPLFRGKIIIAICAFLFLLLLFLGVERKRAKLKISAVFAAVLALMIVFAAVFSSLFVERSERALVFADGKEHTVCALIGEVSYTGDYSSSYIAEVVSIDENSADFEIKLTVVGAKVYSRGDIIEFDAVPEELDETGKYLRADKIFLAAETENARFTGERREGILLKLRRANEYLSKRFISFLGEENGGFCSALVLGNRELVSQSTKLSFTRLGISHILSLSGLHLAVIAATLELLLRRIIRKRTRNIILIAACAFFAVFTGLSASVLRSAIMLSLFYLADTLGERADALTSLSVAAFLILLFDPYSVYDVGFWLSVTATLGIITLSPYSEALFSKWRAPKKGIVKMLRAIAKYFYGIFTMSIAATFFSLPVSFLVFGELSIIGPLANFIFIGIINILIPLCVLFIPFSFVPYLSSLLALPIKLLSSLTLTLAQKFSLAEGIFVSLRYPFSFVFLAVLLIFLIVLLLKKEVRLLRAAAFMLALVVAFSVSVGVYDNIKMSEDDILVSSVDGNDFISLRTGGKSYVFDISSGKYSFMYESAFSVKEFSLTEIDTYVLTHYHRNAQSALSYISERIMIRKILLPYPETESEEEIFAGMMRTFASLGIETEVYTRGERYFDENITVDFAPRRELSRSVKPLTAFKITLGERTFSYAESAVFESNFDYGEYIKADTLFVGAHGADRKFRASLEEVPRGVGVIFTDSAATEYFRDFSHIEEMFYLSDFAENTVHLLYKD